MILRIEFLKRISVTALLVTAIRTPMVAKTKGNLKRGPKKLPEIPVYPMSATDEILFTLANKVYRDGMEFDTFLKMVSFELQTLYPVDLTKENFTYKDLYFVSIRSEVVFQLVVKLVEVWQNLCIQFGLEDYQKNELEKDSLKIQDWILSLGDEFKVGETPYFFLNTKEDLNWIPSKNIFAVPWLGSHKEEVIQFFPLPLEFQNVSNDSKLYNSTLEYKRNTIYEILSVLSLLLYRLQTNLALWHQYTVRFYYLNFVDQYLSKIQTQNEPKEKNKFTKNLFLIRSVSVESAIRTIKERAFHMQSGVYHAIDRQNQQMVVSSLIQTIGQVSVATGGDKDLCKRLRLVNRYGGNLTLSTAATATGSLPFLEDALEVLQKERKLYFP